MQPDVELEVCVESSTRTDMTKLWNVELSSGVQLVHNVIQCVCRSSGRREIQRTDCMRLHDTSLAAINWIPHECLGGILNTLSDCCGQSGLSLSICFNYAILCPKKPQCQAQLSSFKAWKAALSRAWGAVYPDWRTQLCPERRSAWKIHENIWKYKQWNNGPCETLITLIVSFLSMPDLTS